MKIKDQAAWESWVANNTDPYGSGVIRYAERWADLMEQRMGEGRLQLTDVARQASHNADTEGITGFMYGVAVSVLATTWEHGEELRQWHNLDTQIHDEGEHANKREGVVLNPALLNIAVSD